MQPTKIDTLETQFYCAVQPACDLETYSQILTINVDVRSAGQQGYLFLLLSQYCILSPEPLMGSYMYMYNTVLAHSQTKISSFRLASCRPTCLSKGLVVVPLTRSVRMTVLQVKKRNLSLTCSSEPTNQENVITNDDST